MIYLASFVVIEVCLFVVRGPLDKDDRAKAVKLLRKWGTMRRVPSKTRSGRKKGIVLEPALADFRDMMCLAVGCITNYLLFCGMVKYFPFTNSTQLFRDALPHVKELFSTPWYWVPAKSLIAIFMMSTLFAITMPFAVLEGLSSVSVFALPAFISLVVAELVQRYQRYFLKSLDEDDSRFGPATMAFTTVLLAVVAYCNLLGVRGGLSYDCSTTTQKSFYDFLG
jgi:hypothetical protein